MVRTSRHRTTVVHLDEEGRALHVPAAESNPDAPGYFNRTVLYSFPAWLDAGRRPRVLKRSRSETGILSWASKGPKTMNEIMQPRMKEGDEAEVKTEENVVDLVDPAALSTLAPHVEQAFQKVRGAMFPVCAMHNIDLR